MELARAGGTKSILEYIRIYIAVISETILWISSGQTLRFLDLNRIIRPALEPGTFGDSNWFLPSARRRYAQSKSRSSIPRDSGMSSSLDHKNFHLAAMLLPVLDSAGADAIGWG